MSSGVDGSRFFVGDDTVVLQEKYDPNFKPTDPEIEEYARFLGMELPKDKEFLWIAREGLVAPLPKDWKPCKIKASGEVYYFNFSNGDSSWDHPVDMQCRAKFKEEKEKAKKASANQQKVQQQSKREQRELRKNKSGSSAASGLKPSKKSNDWGTKLEPVSLVSLDDDEPSTGSASSSSAKKVTLDPKVVAAAEKDLAKRQEEYVERKERQFEEWKAKQKKKFEDQIKLIKSNNKQSVKDMQASLQEELSELQKENEGKIQQAKERHANDLVEAKKKFQEQLDASQREHDEQLAAARKQFESTISEESKKLREQNQQLDADIEEENRRKKQLLNSMEEERDMLNKQLDLLEQQNATELRDARNKFNDAIAQAEKDHKAKVEALSDDHASKVKALNENHEDELQRIRNENAAAIEQAEQSNRVRRQQLEEEERMLNDKENQLRESRAEFEARFKDRKDQLEEQWKREFDLQQNEHLRRTSSEELERFEERHRQEILSRKQKHAKEMDVLQRQFDEDLSSARRKYTASNEALRQQETSAKASLEVVQGQVSETQRELDELKAQIQKQRKNMEQQAVQAQESASMVNVGLQEENQDLQSQVAKLEQSEAASKKQNTRLLGMVQNLQSDCRKYRSDISSLEAERDEARAQLSTAKIELDENRSGSLERLELLEGQLEESRRMVKQNEENTKTRLERARAVYERTIGQLKREIAGLKSQTDSDENASSTKLAAVEAARDDLEHQVSELRLANIDHQDEISTLRASISSLERARDAAIAAEKDAKKRNSDLSDQLARATSKSVSGDSRLSALHTQVQALEAEVSSLESRLEESQKQLRERERELEQAQQIPAKAIHSTPVRSASAQRQPPMTVGEPIKSIAGGSSSGVDRSRSDADLAQAEENAPWVQSGDEEEVIDEEEEDERPSQLVRSKQTLEDHSLSREHERQSLFSGPITNDGDVLAYMRRHVRSQRKVIAKLQRAVIDRKAHWLRQQNEYQKRFEGVSSRDDAQKRKQYQKLRSEKKELDERTRHLNEDIRQLRAIQEWLVLQNAQQRYRDSHGGAEASSKKHNRRSQRSIDDADAAFERLHAMYVNDREDDHRRRRRHRHSARKSRRHAHRSDHVHRSADRYEQQPAEVYNASPSKPQDRLAYLYGKPFEPEPHASIAPLRSAYGPFGSDAMSRPGYVHALPQVPAPYTGSIPQRVSYVDAYAGGSNVPSGISKEANHHVESLKRMVGRWSSMKDNAMKSALNEQYNMLEQFGSSLRQSVGNSQGRVGSSVPSAVGGPFVPMPAAAAAAVMSSPHGASPVRPAPQEIVVRIQVDNGTAAAVAASPATGQ